MPSSHLILCRPLLLLPPIPPSIRVFSNESTLRMRWPKYRSFSFSTSPSKEHPGPISFRMDWLDLLAVQGLSRVFSNTTVQKHQFFSTRKGQLGTQFKFYMRWRKSTKHFLVIKRPTVDKWSSWKAKAQADKSFLFSWCCEIQRDQQEKAMKRCWAQVKRKER